MAEPQLSVISSKALKLAQFLAKKERRTVEQVVERALELYSQAQPTREAAPDFTPTLRANMEPMWIWML